MAARRPSGKAMFAGAAVLVAFGGLGAAGYVAATDDESPSPTGPFAAAAESEPSATGQAPAAAAEPTTPTDESPAQPDPDAAESTAPTETTAPDDTTAPSDTTGPTETSATRKTRFPRDRRKRRARRIPKRFAIPPAHEFSGRGNASLGTVDLREQAVVKWSSRGSLSIQFGREEFPIVAPAATGELIVPPYRFELVRVIAKGRWRISITPQK